LGILLKKQYLTRTIKDCGHSRGPLFCPARCRKDRLVESFATLLALTRVQASAGTEKP
jgi:hypothetical protein